MSSSVRNVSLVFIWIVAGILAFFIATGTSSLVAWIILALISLMPPLMLMVLAHTPARTISQIIYDLETGTTS